MGFTSLSTLLRVLSFIPNMKVLTAKEREAVVQLLSSWVECIAEPGRKFPAKYRHLKSALQKIATK